MIIISKFAPIALFYIMLCIGMSTNIKNFVKVFKDYKTLLVGLTSQIVILPFIGILFAIFLTNDPVLKVGIILIICMPSAVASNYVAKLANGNITLSVSLTAITASLSFITIPFMFTVISPILINESIILQNSYSSLFLFLLIIIGAWIVEWVYVIELYKTIGVLVALLSAIVLIMVNILVNIFKLNLENKRTIIIETFIQNGAMAIIVGELALGFGSGYMTIAAIYALFQYKILCAWWFMKKFASGK